MLYVKDVHQLPKLKCTNQYNGSEMNYDTQIQSQCEQTTHQWKKKKDSMSKQPNIYTIKTPPCKWSHPIYDTWPKAVLGEIA